MIYGRKKRVPYRWFAWRPVRIRDGRWVWRQWVARCDVGNWGGPGYHYDLLPESYHVAQDGEIT
jgi:hypothetical protein